MTAKRRKKAIRREERRKAFEDQNPGSGSCMVSSSNDEQEKLSAARSNLFPKHSSLPIPIHKSQSNPGVSSLTQFHHHQSLPPTFSTPIPYAREDPSSSSHWGPRSSAYPTYPIPVAASAGESSTPGTMNRSVQMVGDPSTNSKHVRLSGQISGAVPAYPMLYNGNPASGPRRGQGFVGAPATNTRVSQKETTVIDVENPSRPQTHQNQFQSNVQGSNAERRSPLIASGSRSDYLDMCVPLYRAALKGDWGLAKSILDKHPTAFLYGITAGEETVLHIAAAAKHVGFVKKLVDHMGEDDLTLQNKYGNTALCFAAASGVVNIAEIMVEKNKKLPMIPGSQKMVPLHLAALLGHRSMSYYLYNVTIFELLEREEKVELLSATISTGIYDLALGILKKDPSLAITRNRNKETALHVLARKPSEISWDIELGVKDKVFKKCKVWYEGILHVWYKNYGANICSNLEHNGFNCPKFELRRLGSHINQHTSFKWMYNKALMKTLAHQLVAEIWNKVLQLQENEITDLISSPSRLLFDAVEQGNVEFLVMLIRSYPDLMWTVNGNRYSLFHTAILCRQERILKLIYEIGAIKELLVCLTDKDNNNMLHLAGRLAPTSRLTIVSGAALQMQRELLWFKKVENIVPPSFTKMKNSKGQTPQELFTVAHQALRKDGEKWMKDTATSCMLVATLIATVVFAAAFTVPGGNDNDDGIPVLLKEKWFTTFAVSDALAMLTSTTSILMFLSILTSRYAEEDFLVSLPGKLTLGLTTLFASIGSMVLAFTAAFFLVYHGEMKSVPILIACLAGVPVTMFVLLYYKLLVEVLRSTLWSKFLFLHNKRRLF